MSDPDRLVSDESEFSRMLSFWWIRTLRNQTKLEAFETGGTEQWRLVCKLGGSSSLAITVLE